MKFGIVESISKKIIFSTDINPNDIRWNFKLSQSSVILNANLNPKFIIECLFNSVLKL